mgnify:CR=1 FL=1
MLKLSYCGLLDNISGFKLATNKHVLSILDDFIPAISHKNYAFIFTYFQ